ncbi:MAG: nucleoside hydrolase [Bacteroidota bacterium]
MMKNLNRRRFLGLSGAALAAMNMPAISRHHVISNEGSNGPAPERSNGPVPMIHAGDIYHEYADPDDHFDLATVYALASSGLVDLKGILFDWPLKRFGDPDVMGVAQMNYISGLVVPSVTGSPQPMKHRNDVKPDLDTIELQGVNWLIKTLKRSDSPVVINIVGASTNVAIALKKDPELFRNKCKAIYLNAGIGLNNKGEEYDYNVKLDPSSYAAIFDAPCPVYWLPVYEDRKKLEVGGYGSKYSFMHDDIFRYLPKKLLNFFLFMLARSRHTKWLEYLNEEPDRNVIAWKGPQSRAMWCTAGFLHAAGKKVTTKGVIVPLDAEEEAVCSFEPVDAHCDDQGYTSWEADPQSTTRYIFHVDNVDHYGEAMTSALRDMLLWLPEN